METFSVEPGLIDKTELQAENDLVARCRQGDQQAFHDLVRIHGSIIAGIARRMAFNRDLEKEIFQEVAVRVIESIAKFEGRCRLSTWLYRITVNAALNVLAKEKSGRSAVSLESLPDLRAPSGEGNALDRAAERELFLKARQGLLSLPQGNQEILSAFYFAEMSVNEIARDVGKSAGAVKAVLFKGRKAIAEYLKKQGVIAP
jgi:RNA polymerase sigma-70 factor (ECF subfamily)